MSSRSLISSGRDCLRVLAVPGGARRGSEGLGGAGRGWKGLGGARRGSEGGKAAEGERERREPSKSVNPLNSNDSAHNSSVVSLIRLGFTSTL